MAHNAHHALEVVNEVGGIGGVIAGVIAGLVYFSFGGVAILGMRCPDGYEVQQVLSGISVVCHGSENAVGTLTPESLVIGAIVAFLVVGIATGWIVTKLTGNRSE